MRQTKILLILFFSMSFIRVNCQANFDENKIQKYELPELLISINGAKISDSISWIKTRRPEILTLFEENLYGQIPSELKISSWKVLEESKNALEGKAIRKQILLTFKKNGKQLDVNLLIFLPKNGNKAPLFVGYNFYGNLSDQYSP